MNIFCCYHHSSLYSSYLYTLEQRLGHSCYRMIGEQWFHDGYWKINKQRDTIAQYLGTYGYQPTDGTPSLNQVMWVQDGVYYSKDPNTGQVHKAITFEKFMEMDIDVVIASIPKHIEPFQKLAKMKNAKFVFQEGNNFNLPDLMYPNLMSSTMPRETKCHSIFYHQEFDTTIFKPLHVETGKPEIHNYMNCLKNYPVAYDFFIELEKEMPDYVFKMYGAQNRDGCITGVQNLADAMNRARWGFHVKPGGDGYGHVLHNTFACGLPLITMRNYYSGHLGGRFMNDQNCLSIDSMSPKQAAEYIRNNESRRDELSKSVYNQFVHDVDFSQEARDIDTFLHELI